MAYVLKDLKAAPEDTTLVNFKATAADKRRILALAKKYAGGNVSLWLRYAGANCRPRKEDLTAV